MAGDGVFNGAIRADAHGDDGREVAGFGEIEQHAIDVGEEADETVVVQAPAPRVRNAWITGSGDGMGGGR